MRAFPCLLPLAFAVLAFSARAESGAKGSLLNQAAVFYHQGRFDSALARLEGMKSQGPWKRRDSLSLFQYLGMASARLGREDEAAGYFSGLLGLDSLFQFPRNEDPQILTAFARAGAQREAEARAAAAAAAIAAAPDSSAGRGMPGGKAMGIATGPFTAPDRERISVADSGAPGSGQGPKQRNIGLALGAMPLGVGWLARRKVGNGLALGLLQAGGIALSLYASGMQSREENDTYRVRDKGELASVQSWQWVQRVSLSTALGAYLFSLIASTGD